jgi:GNAT superfamily N-acetyltransferase
VESARPATAADLPRLAELATAAIEELAPTRGGAIWALQSARPQPVEASLREVLDDPDQLLLAGEVDGAVIGYAAVRLAPLRDGAPLAVLDDIYVEAGARGVGVGEALMDAVVEWATDRGCIGIDSVALPGNRATKNFFESFGLVARAIVVHRPLGGRGGAGAEGDEGGGA